MWGHGPIRLWAPNMHIQLWQHFHDSISEEMRAVREALRKPYLCLTQVIKKPGDVLLHPAIMA